MVNVTIYGSTMDPMGNKDPYFLVIINPEWNHWMTGPPINDN